MSEALPVTVTSGAVAPVCYLDPAKMMSSEKYRRHMRDIHAFGEALNHFLEVMESHVEGFLPGEPRKWAPRPGQEQEAARRKAEVDLASGRAAYAFVAGGAIAQFKPRGTMRTTPVNPAHAWATILSWDPMFDVDDIFAYAHQALGILDMKAEEAEEQERRPVRRAVGALARMTGSGLAPLARWAVRGVGFLILTVAAAGLIFWLGWN